MMPSSRELLQEPALQKIVTARAQSAHALLHQYLAGQGFFGCGRAALVDVGWSGTIQNNLARAFGDDPGFPELYGLYLALTEMPAVQRQHLPLTSHKEGLLYDYRVGEPSLLDRAPYWFEELFELAAQGPHGTTLGYAPHGDRVEAVLKEDDAARRPEANTRAAVAEIQRGILDYARAYGRFAELGNLSLERQIAEAKREVAHFIFKPSARSLAAVRALMHSADWGTDDQHPLLADDGLLSWLSQGRASIARFSGSFWKHGEARRLGGPLLNQLYHLYTWYKN